MTTIRLDAIVFDAGTQVREAINEQVVADYADRLHEGVEFPAVVLFHDGNRYYMADGFHRGMAHLRLGREEIAAEVRPGTREDALWFALGANKANGQRMTEGDKKHAVLMALQTWKDYSAGRIAEQIGCSQDYVSHIRAKVMRTFDLPERVVGKDGKTYKATAAKRHPSHDDVVQALEANEPVHAIAKRLHMGVRTVTAIRDDVGVDRGPDRSLSAVAKRRERMRRMAEAGYTTRQIAADVGLSERSCRAALRDAGVAVVADAVVGKTLRHDSNRILDQIVVDAENLTAGVNLIDFGAVDRTRLPEWLASLQSSRDAFSAFIRRLQKETQHGQVA